MNILERKTQDGWGSDIYYAVSAELTRLEDYNEEGGVIKIIDEHDRLITDPQTRAQYVLFSSGPDRIGVNDERCDEDRLDGENCNGDAVFRFAGLSLGTQHYDDILSYAVWVPPVEYASGQCSVMDYLADDMPDSFFEAGNVDRGMFYLQPGEMVFVCNEDILDEFEKENCMLFVCRQNNVLQYVETIE